MTLLKDMFTSIAVFSIVAAAVIGYAMWIVRNDDEITVAAESYSDCTKTEYGLTVEACSDINNQTNCLCSE